MTLRSAGQSLAGAPRRHRLRALRRRPARAGADGSRGRNCCAVDAARRQSGRVWHPPLATGRHANVGRSHRSVAGTHASSIGWRAWRTFPNHARPAHLSTVKYEKAEGADTVQGSAKTHRRLMEVMLSWEVIRTLGYKAQQRITGSLRLHHCWTACRAQQTGSTSACCCSRSSRCPQTSRSI